MVSDRLLTEVERKPKSLGKLPRRRLSESARPWRRVQ